jgi:hypothetical protein
MEENIISDNASPKPPKKSNSKSFFWGLSTGFFIIFIVFGFVEYNDMQNRKKIAEENRKYQLEHAVVMQDSLRKVAIIQAKYREMVYKVHKFDSARATLRYRIGDVVYLKPDSTRAAVSEITVDSSLCIYNYILLMHNSEGMPVMFERKEKLIY